MPLRILHVLTTNHRRGAETFAVSLGQGLDAVRFTSTTVALSPSTSEPAPLPVEVIGNRWRSVSTLGELRLRAKQAEVVVAHGSSTLAACALALLGTKVPFVYVNIGDPLYWAPSPLKRLRLRALLSRPSAVVTLSEDAAVVLRQALGVHPSRIKVVPNGRDSSKFVPLTHAERVEARAQLGLSGQSRVVVCLGSLSREKRIDVAIATIAQLPDVRLVIAGEGLQRAALQRLALTLAPGRVSFVGSVSDPRQVVGIADCVLLTSESEGLPGVLIEAGLMQVPAVATDVGFVRDVVLDGRTGTLVPTNDPVVLAEAVRRTLDRPASGFGAAARAHCRSRFELKAVIKSWEEVLLDMASSRPSGGSHQ